MTLPGFDDISDNESILPGFDTDSFNQKDESNNINRVTQNYTSSFNNTSSGLKPYSNDNNYYSNTNTVTNLLSKDKKFVSFV